MGECMFGYTILSLCVYGILLLTGAPLCYVGRKNPKYRKYAIAGIIIYLLELALAFILVT